MVRPGGHPCALSLYDSVLLVTHLLRRNPVEAVTAGFFGVAQAHCLSALGPSSPGDPTRLGGPRSRSVCVHQRRNHPGPRRRLSRLGLRWPRRPVFGQGRIRGDECVDRLLDDGDLAVIGPVPILGARSDAYASAASGLKVLMAAFTNSPTSATSGSRASTAPAPPACGCPYDPSAPTTRVNPWPPGGWLPSPRPRPLERGNPCG